MNLGNLGAKLAANKAKLIAGAAVLVALVIAVGAAHHIGYTKGSARSDLEISRYEKQVSDLNIELKNSQGKVTERIVTEYVPRVVERTRVVTRNVEVIKEVVPEQWVLSKGWIYAYNQTILGEPIDPALAANEEPSGVYDSTALDVIGQNNGIANANHDQLVTLQEWVRQQQEATNEARATDR